MQKGTTQVFEGAGPRKKQDRDGFHARLMENLLQKISKGGGGVYRGRESSVKSA